jgi:hypothetical protein
MKNDGMFPFIEDDIYPYLTPYYTVEVFIMSMSKGQESVVPAVEQRSVNLHLLHIAVIW